MTITVIFVGAKIIQKLCFIKAIADLLKVNHVDMEGFLNNNIKSQSFLLLSSIVDQFPEITIY